MRTTSVTAELYHDRMSARRTALLLVAWTTVGKMRPSIPFRPHAVVVPGTPAELIAEMRSRLQSGDVLLDGGDRLLARFSGRAGPFRYRTLELVSFAPGEVHFEHLGGSLHACGELFAFRDEGGRTRVVHSGSFTMRGGLLGWALGLAVVRRLFEAHVTEHIASLASAARPEAGR